MPIAVAISGTVTRVAAGGTAATGTLSATGYSSGTATGTLSVDRTIVNAFFAKGARVRLTRPDLYIDDELMTTLVGQVKIDWSLSDPVTYAEFFLSDKRASFLDPDSVSKGSLPVEIDFLAGPPGSVKMWPAFVGNMETSSNSMPYRTRGDLRAVSLAYLWANTQGCLNIPAMSGLTRGAAIAAFAESAGVSIVNAATLGGGIITKPLDIAGKTPFQLIQEWGEVEGWFARATEDGSGLEIISEDTILDGEPVFSFDESNTKDCPETTPDRPVTEWVLSGTQMAPSGAGSGIAKTRSVSSAVDGGGNRSDTITEITTDSGVEIYRIVTQYATVPTPGVTPSAPAYQIVSRVTTDSHWEPFTYVDAAGVTSSMPSTQLNSRTTMTEELTGVPNATGGYAWAEGGSWTEASARLIKTKQVEEAFTYNGCYQDSSAVITTSYYSPKVASGDWAYPDGSSRRDTSYLFIETSAVETHWSLIEIVDALTSVATPIGYFEFVATSSWTTLGAGANETYRIASASNDSNTPPSGSSTAPQFAQQLMVYDYDATVASGYARLLQNATIDFAENLVELDAIARRRIRRALSDSIAIPHKAIPFLRVGDHVSVTTHSRSLVDVDAYVETIERTAEVANGAMDQITTVTIPPDWI